MKKNLPFSKLTFVLLVMVFTMQRLQAQPLLTENFDYAAGALLTSSGWTAHSGAGTQPVDVAVPGLTFAGYPLSNIGGMAQLDNNGEDVNKTFTAQTTGAVYAAFMVKVDAIADGYFLHFGPASMGSTYIARLYIKPGTGDKYKFALGKTTENPVLSDAEFTQGTTYLAVLKYEIVDGATNDKVSFYLIDGTLPATEPATATIPAFTTTATDNNPGSIGLRQFNASQRIFVDGLRIATSWAEAVTAALAGDTNPPVFGTNYPKVSNINSTQADLEVTLNEAGKAYYVVVPNDAPAPTAAQVFAGINYGTVTLLSAGSINVTAGGSVFSVTITGLTDKTNYDIYVIAQDDEAAPNKQADPVKVELYTTKPADVLLTVNFETSLDPFKAVSVSGDQQWEKATYGGNSYAYINGYSGSAKANTDWLISPAIKLESATDIAVSFKTAKNYNGPDLKVKLSTNFTGEANASAVAAATWTDITSSFEFSGGSFAWKPSGEYKITTASGNAYVAFVYESTTEGAAAWEVDDFLVTGFLKTSNIIQESAISFRFYPNPVQDVLHIENLTGFSHLEIFDMAGTSRHVQLLNGENRLAVPVGNLPRGMYIIRLNSANGLQVEKFIRQ